MRGVPGRAGRSVTMLALIEIGTDWRKPVPRALQRRQGIRQNRATLDTILQRPFLLSAAAEARLVLMCLSERMVNTWNKDTRQG